MRGWGVLTKITQSSFILKVEEKSFHRHFRSAWSFHGLNNNSFYLPIFCFCTNCKLIILSYHMPYPSCAVFSCHFSVEYGIFISQCVNMVRTSLETGRSVSIISNPILEFFNNLQLPLCNKSF